MKLHANFGNFQSLSELQKRVETDYAVEDVLLHIGNLAVRELEYIENGFAAKGFWDGRSWPAMVIPEGRVIEAVIEVASSNGARKMTRFVETHYLRPKAVSTGEPLAGRPGSAFGR